MPDRETKAPQPPVPAQESEEDVLPPEVIGRVVFTGQTPNLQQVHFRLRPGKTTTAGKLVAIESMDAAGRSTLVLARVANIFEHNPHEDPLSSTVQEVIPFPTKYAAEGHSTVIYRYAEAEPLEEAVLAGDSSIETIRSVETLPRSGALVLEASDDLTVSALGLEPDPDKGLYVGTVRGNRNVKVVLNKGTIQRHIFIGGGIGSGKSYTRGVLAEELHCLGIPQINVDVNGEMIEATEELGGINLVPGKEGFTLPLSALTSDDVTEAIPGVSPTTNIYTLIRYAHDRLLRERTFAKGEHFGVDDLVKKIEQVAPDLNMQAAATLRPAMMRAESLNRLQYIGPPFDWAKHLTPGRMVNIDCRGMLVTDLRLIVASIARDIQRLAQKRSIGFVVFSIDEFHLVAPNDDKVVTTQVLREIARIGRHYKISLILTTQSPSDVDRAILKRLLTRFLHAIEPDQLDSLRGVFSDASEDLIKRLPKMPVGTCILTGAAETVKHATMIDIRSRSTTHGGKTPDIWADLESAGWKGKKALKPRKKAK